MRISASVLILICSLVLGFAGWMATLGTWGDALRPVTLAGLLGSFAGVVLAWLGKSPLKNGNGNGNAVNGGGKVPPGQAPTPTPIL